MVGEEQQVARPRTLGGTLGAPLGINHDGEIAGWTSTKGDQFDHAVLWKNGKITDLGTVAGDKCSYGFGINSKGQVIGISADCALMTLRAFLWEEGGPMVDLNPLIPVVPVCNWNLQKPSTIVAK